MPTILTIDATIDVPPLKPTAEWGWFFLQRPICNPPTDFDSDLTNEKNLMQFVTFNNAPAQHNYVVIITKFAAQIS